MKSPEERGPVGAWMVDERGRLNLSVEEVRARLRTIGEPVSEPYLRGIEAGRRPSQRIIAALSKVFGSSPPAARPAATLDTLVSALAAQTEALNALVARLDERSEADEALRALLVEPVRQARRAVGDTVPRPGDDVDAAVAEQRARDAVPGR
jgi:hypothetical protein